MKYFVNFGAVNYWDVVASSQKVGGCNLHMQNRQVCVVSTKVYRLIFTKFSANVEWLVHFITVNSNCDGLMKRCCYGNRFVAHVGKNWYGHPVFIISAGIRHLLRQSQHRLLHQHRRSEHLYTSDKNFLNFGPVTSLAGNGWVHVCVVFTGVRRLMFTKLSAGIEQIMGFIVIYWNCDGSLKGRCYSNRFVAHVGENWHTPSSFFRTLWADF